jgi:hypothetical protein
MNAALKTFSRYVDHLGVLQVLLGLVLCAEMAAHWHLWAYSVSPENDVPVDHFRCFFNDAEAQALVL